MNASQSPQAIARIAAVSYVVTFVAGGLALSARGSLGIATNLIADAAYVVVTFLFYELFKPVSRNISFAAAAFSLAGCGIGLVKLFHLASFPINTLVFFGVYCVLIGYLVFRSTFLPRFLAVLMVIAGLGWLTFIYPPLAKSLAPFGMAISAAGEAALTLWLLVFGVAVDRWKILAGSASRIRTEGNAAGSLAG